MSTYYIYNKPKSFNIDQLPAPGYLKTFLAAKLDNGLSRHTVQEYYMTIRTFLKWLLCRQDRDIDFDDADIEKCSFDLVKSVTPEDIRKFMHYLVDERDNRSSSVMAKLSALKTFYHYFCVDMGHIQADPTLNIQPVNDKRTTVKTSSAPLSEQECVRLLNAACNSENPARDYCILMLFLNSGLRLTELVSINCYDISDNVIKIRGSKSREIYLNDVCQDALSDWLLERSTFSKLYDGGDLNALFVSRRLGKRMTPRNIQLILDKTFKLAGIEKHGRSIQDLRTAAASMMFRSGNVGIPELHNILGNTSSLPVPQYTKSNPEQVRFAMEDFQLSASEEDIRHKQSVLPQKDEDEDS